MTDKAVSTEDLGAVVPRHASLEAARLEAVLATLVENKVETLKQQDRRKSSSIHSSPKSLLNKFRLTSTSTVSSSDKEEFSLRSQDQKVWKKARNSCTSIKNPKIISGPISERPNLKLQYSKVHNCEKTASFSEENINFLPVNVPSSTHFPPVLNCSESCYCQQETNGAIRMHFDDDFIALKIEEFDEVDAKEMLARRARRNQRKKRKRRKQRLKQHQLAINTMTTIPVSENFKVLDADELSQRARFTIVVTACLLLFMCLLLVGITLRMAPIIDDMVRKENEELMNSLNRESAMHNSLHNSTASVPSNLT